jgi:hypothetical protein
MDVAKILADLRNEREAIEEAILTLERLANGQGRRRGRPPSWLAAIRKNQSPPQHAPKGRATGQKAPSAS